MNTENPKPRQVDCYILRDIATGKHTELVVSPEPWIRQRVHACLGMLKTQLHVTVDHVRTHEVAEPEKEQSHG